MQTTKRAAPTLPSLSISIPLDIISEVIQGLWEDDDFATLANTSLTCNAVAPLCRARLFYSVELLVRTEDPREIAVQISRLRKLDILFTNNPMLPTYVRKFEFGNLSSELLWFKNEPALPRVLDSLGQLKIFLIAGTIHLNMDWSQFDEALKRSCIRACARPTLEVLDLSSIENLPIAFITETVQLNCLDLTDTLLIVGDPIPFTSSDPPAPRALKTLTFWECEGTTQLFLQQMALPNCRFDLSELQDLKVISEHTDDINTGWSIAALTKESLQNFHISSPDPYISPPLHQIRRINSFSQLRDLNIDVEITDFYELLKNTSFPELVEASIGIRLQSDDVREKSGAPLVNTLYMKEIDGLIAGPGSCMPTIYTIILYFHTGIRLAEGHMHYFDTGLDSAERASVDDLRGRFQNQLLELFPALCNGEAAVRFRLLNAIVEVGFDED